VDDPHQAIIRQADRWRYLRVWIENNDLKWNGWWSRRCEISLPPLLGENGKAVSRRSMNDYAENWVGGCESIDSA
jgi:hypothetical protein